MCYNYRKLLQIPTRHGCNYIHQQSYNICVLWFHISWISNGCFIVIFATDIQLIPVRKIDLIIRGFSFIVFATDIQPITVQKIITFITEICFPEAYCHHKCQMVCRFPPITKLQIDPTHIYMYTLVDMNGMFLLRRSITVSGKHLPNQNLPLPHHFKYITIARCHHPSNP